MRYFLDTEFVEDGETIMPISLALVRENGDSLYLEYDFDEAKAEAHDFVSENVLPHLAGQERYTRDDVRDRILSFVGDAERPEFWAYYASFDWVVFCQTFGTMGDFPSLYPWVCFDLMQHYTLSGRPCPMPPQPKRQHHALADAQWNLLFFQQIQKGIQFRADVQGGNCHHPQVMVMGREDVGGQRFPVKWCQACGAIALDTEHSEGGWMPPETWRGVPRAD